MEDCQVWDGGTFAGGYPRKGRNTPAHVEAFKAYGGQVPEGWVVHHDTARTSFA